jgi:outer membrane protein OmpA-like peptidoglycan-associated protein
MKKLFLVFAAAMLTASVSAQRTTVTANKAQDNWYVGINAGVATPMSKYSFDARGDKKAGFFKGITPEFGIRVGKNLTTVFGLALDVDAYFANKQKGMYGKGKSMVGSKTFINGTAFDLMTTWNLMNAFAGYQGQPRTFEVIALVGGGYTRDWARKEGGINAKAAIDFAMNLGADKEWQVYLEPYAMLANGWANPFRKSQPAFENEKKLNGMFGLKAGVNYKFACSNGTHNFAVEQLRDQAEIDGLNARINGLRGELDGKDAALAAKDRQIADLQKALDECNAKPKYVKPETATNLQPTVLFRQGKSTIDAAQYAPIELIAHYMKNHPDAKIEIKGYASPEGKAEFNQKLSQARAEAVKNALVKKYKIAADRLSTKGMGATNKLFEQVEFNRVATFNDNAK